jgi:hypothetical protein
MAARLSALHAGRFLPPGRFMVLISVRGWVDPRVIVRLEGLGKLKKNTSSRTRTGDLPAYSIVPQPATLPRAPVMSCSLVKIIDTETSSLWRGEEILLTILGLISFKCLRMVARGSIDHKSLTLQVTDLFLCANLCSYTSPHNDSYGGCILKNSHRRHI